MRGGGVRLDLKVSACGHLSLHTLEPAGRAQSAVEGFLGLANGPHMGYSSSVPGIVPSASCALLHSIRNKAAAILMLRESKSPLTAEPVKGGAGRPGPVLGASVFPSAACAGGLPRAIPEVLPPSGQASGCPSQCVAYRFQFLGRRLNTSEGPIEAAAKEGATE